MIRHLFLTTTSGAAIAMMLSAPAFPIGSDDPVDMGMTPAAPNLPLLSDGETMPADLPAPILVAEATDAASAKPFKLDGFIRKMNTFATRELIGKDDPRLSSGTNFATEEVIASLDAYEQRRVWRDEMLPDLERAIAEIEKMQTDAGERSRVGADASLTERAFNAGDFLEDQGTDNWLQYTVEQLELATGDSARESAEAVLEGIELQATTMEYLPVLQRMRSASAVGPQLDLAGRFVPGDEDLDARIADMRAMTDPMITAAYDSAREEIAGQEWPGGDADAPEVEGAMARIEEHPDWGGGEDEILKVTIEGDWFVFRRNILSQLVQYAISGYVAAKTPLTPEGMVRVYHVSFVTREAAKDPDDFGAIAVTPENWTMLESNLP